MGAIRMTDACAVVGGLTSCSLVLEGLDPVVSAADQSVIGVVALLFENRRPFRSRMTYVTGQYASGALILPANLLVPVHLVAGSGHGLSGKDHGNGSCQRLSDHIVLPADKGLVLING